MAVVRHFGYPDLFITFTCNPKWPEILRFLFGKNVNPEDRPEILCRLFKIKLDSMINDFKEKHVFGELDAGIGSKNNFTLITICIIYYIYYFYIPFY